MATSERSVSTVSNVELYDRWAHVSHYYISFEETDVLTAAEIRCRWQHSSGCR